MAQVPQSTLSWLYGVLTKNHSDPNQTYRDPNRAYHDVAEALAQYPSFGPRTDVYTRENGASSLLLHLAGTLPVAFRGQSYYFPIDVWIPNTYPYEAPIVYVTATHNMVIRVGQHVTLEGRVYHHYLAHWSDAWDKVSLVELFAVLRDVFAKEPPVKSKTAPVLQVQQQPHTQSPRPPPVPPLPVEMAPPTVKTPAQPTQPSVPPLPPKPGQDRASKLTASSGISSARSPPLPPPPPPDLHRQSIQYLGQANGGPQAQPLSSYLPARSSSMRTATTVRQPGQPTTPHNYPASSADSTYAQPIRPPFSPKSDQAPLAHHPGVPKHVPPLPPGPEYTQQIPHPRNLGNTQQISVPPPSSPSYNQPVQPPSRPNYQIPPQYHPVPNPMHAPPPPQAVTKRQTPDLLTSPFDLELPSMMPSGPAPPIPPNPEKDELLHSLAKSVGETIRNNVAQSRSALQPLHSQSHALHAAISTLQNEIASILPLQSTLQSNITVLQDSLRKADTVIAGAQARILPPPQPPLITTPIPTATGPFAAKHYQQHNRSSSTSSPSRRTGTPDVTGVAGVTSTSSLQQEQLSSIGSAVSPIATAIEFPSIDDVLVAPTVVGKQLYDLVADERGIQQAIYALQAALVKGVIGVDSWSRHTRSLAREAFLKRALIVKIGKGLGLDIPVQGSVF